MFLSVCGVSNLVFQQGSTYGIVRTCGRGGLVRLANECVRGNSLFLAFIDSESVAITILWQRLTPTFDVL